MKHYKFVPLLVVAMVCVATLAWGQPAENFFGIILGPAGELDDQIGTGDWPDFYYYPDTGWWNMWFFDHLYHPFRTKEMSLEFFYIRAADGVTPWAVEIAFNWSSEEYMNPDEPPIPPITPEDEARYIRRQVVIPWGEYIDPLEPLDLGPFLLDILEYNPVWVSVDIRGYNVALQGTLWHECIEDLDPPEAIKFSVHDDPDTATVGMPVTGVNWNFNNDQPSLEGDIYEGAQGTNWIAILKEKLGLLPNDDIDALSIIDAGTAPGEWIATDPGFFTVSTWYFSVDPGSVGAPGGAPPDVFSQAAKTEAAGDVFFTFFPMPPPVPPGPNMLAIDDWWVGLDDTTAPAPEDDMDALDLFEPAALAGTDPLPFRAVQFSLTPDSPSLNPPAMITPGAILSSDGAGGFMLEYDEVSLGIPGDDLDALFMGGDVVPIYSVAPGSVNALDAADILVLPGVVGPGPIAGVLVPAAALGLAAGGDNLNALDILTGVEPFIVDDTDLDGIPDYWEDEHGLDPGDPDDADDDPDDDGLDNSDEYGNDTDPNEEDSDGDGMSDGFEVDNGFDPNDDDEMGDDGATSPDGTPDGQNDSDGDGISNQDEESGGTDPLVSDVPVAGVFALLVLGLAVCVIALRGRRKETA